ncbi:MAG: GNAT family N-acetyltransferase [Acidimicrobiales bacterium]|nr:GNAT family N-acetyltransferase [Acidimicrobiales bacterium]
MSRSSSPLQQRRWTPRQEFPDPPPPPETETDGAGPMSFGEFVGLIADETGLDLSGAHPGSLLREELGWDSLTMVELLSVLERYGVNLPDDLIGELRTLADVHHYLTGLAVAEGPKPMAPANRDRDLLRGPNVVLMPVTHADHGLLLELHTRGDHLVRFRLRGHTPSPDAFHRLLWDRVLAQFIAWSHDGRPIGLVSCTDANFQNRHAHFSVVAMPDQRGTGLALEAMGMLLSYVFCQFDFRKLYAECLRSNFHQFENGSSRIFEIEGCLREHEYLYGAYEDLLVLAVYREAWRRQHRRLYGEEAPF